MCIFACPLSSHRVMPVEDQLAYSVYLMNLLHILEYASEHLTTHQPYTSEVFLKKSESFFHQKKNLILLWIFLPVLYNFCALANTACTNQKNFNACKVLQRFEGACDAEVGLTCSCSVPSAHTLDFYIAWWWWKASQLTYDDTVGFPRHEMFIGSLPLHASV